MHINIQRLFQPARAPQWQRRMTDDADRLLAELGPMAYEVAADRSWREDVGLLKSSDAGHWSRVTLEIGRRLAAPAASPPRTGITRPRDVPVRPFAPIPGSERPFPEGMARPRGGHTVQRRSEKSTI